MADCIRREEALNCNFRFEIYGRMSRKQIVKEAIQAYSDYIKKIPAVDAVEVIRCKDCKRWKDPHDYKCPCHTSGDPYIDYDPEPDFFCAIGERRIDNG